MRTILIAMAGIITCAGAQQPQTYQGSVGRFDFLCKDGKPVAIRIITISPGEVVVPLPKEPCPPPAARPEAKRQPAPRKNASAPSA